jgi:hypothetical protein
LEWSQTYDKISLLGNGSRQKWKKDCPYRRKNRKNSRGVTMYY